jgi:hypothetical protein
MWETRKIRTYAVDRKKVLKIYSGNRPSATKDRGWRRRRPGSKFVAHVIETVFTVGQDSESWCALGSYNELRQAPSWWWQQKTARR